MPMSTSLKSDKYYVHRERQSYSLSFDWKFNENHKIELRGMYNRRNDWENRYRLTYKDITPDADGTATAYLRRQTKGGSPDNKFCTPRTSADRGHRPLGRTQSRLAGVSSGASTTPAPRRTVPTSATSVWRATRTTRSALTLIFRMNANRASLLRTPRSWRSTRRTSLNSTN